LITRVPEKSDGLLRQGAPVRFGFILAEKVFFPVLLLWRVLEVSLRGFCGWMRSVDRRSARDESDAALTTTIVEAHTGSRGTWVPIPRNLITHSAAT
jgi:hypothetical protein